MRKIISFLALLVIAFALPHRAVAWDFSSGSNPSAINLSLETIGKSVPMTFANSQWTAEFTATQADHPFKINIPSNNAWYGYDNGKVSANATGWTQIWTNSNTGKFHFTDLTAGVTYKVTLTGNSDISCNMKIEPATQQATSWDFRTNTKPTAVTIHMKQGDVDHILTFSDGVWSGTFVIDQAEDNGYVNYYINATDDAGSITKFGNDKGTSDLGAWSSVTSCNEAFSKESYQGGITKGNTYKVEVTADDVNQYKVRFTEAAVAPWDFRTNTKPKAVTIHLTEDNANHDLTFSDGVWSGTFVINNTETNGNYIHYYINATDDAGSITKFGTDKGTGDLGAWSRVTSCNEAYWKDSYQGNITAGKKYKVEVTAEATNEYKVRFTEVAVAPWDFRTNTKPTAVTMHMKQGDVDHVLTFSNGVWSGTFVINNAEDNGYVNYYINATDDAGNITKFGNNKGTNNLGDWSEVTNCNETYSQESYQGGITAGKKYKVEVTADDVNQYKVRFTEAVAVPANVYLPLSSLDFKKGKKHYFLVGERQGEWHLQPEWEFTVVKDDVNGDKLVLENRFMYNGTFAVAVVDKYEDYVYHKYTYYGDNTVFNSTTLTSGNISGNATRYAVTKHADQILKHNTGKNVFWSDIDGKDQYWDGIGTLMSRIEVTLTDGVPQTVTMTKADAETTNQNRLFTLVGSKIFNQNYSLNSADRVKTTMQSRGYSDFDGWQEGWIQYDRNTGKAYVDGNGEYLYHTSFTPDYMMNNPALFNMDVTGGEFSYSSQETQFVEWNKLPNLETDPYKSFYQAFSGKATIATSDTPKVQQASGTDMGYNFKVQVENTDQATTPSADWDCYVVRDMWIAGEFKFWTGWGGNTKKTYGDETGAAWHAMNGGPDAAVHDRKVVQGFDITSGTAATLYKNGKNIDDCNYQIGDGVTPTYFNRVVLWINNTDGVGKSYIQFVQESAGPAIAAQVTTNTDAEPDKDNWIKYNWYLQNAGTTDTSVKVVGYEITRYRMDNGVEVFDGYPEGGYVSVADKPSGPVTIKDLLKGSGTMPSWTTVIDKSADAKLGFTPGLYRYKITITLDSEDGPTKTATSNQVAIYSKEAVTLQPMALQLVKLSDAGKTALGTTKNYLTYSPSDNATFYAVNLTEEVSGTEEIDGNSYSYKVAYPNGTAEEIDGTKALKFLNNNPDMYWWTSDYYVRCLDLDVYKAQLQPQVEAGLIQQPIPEPEVRIMEKFGTDQAYRGPAKLFEHNGHNYYSLVMKRGGNVAQGTILTTLTYTTTKADDSTQDFESKATLTIDPVLPQPYGLTYGYDYIRETVPVTYEGKQWAKVNVPSGHWDNASTATTPVYVKLDNNFRPDRLDLNVKFNRPNVVEEIYNKYDIVYGVSLGVKGASSSDLSFTAVDKKTTDNGNPYAITVNGVRPNNEDKPVFNFATTTYEPNATAKADYSELGRNNGTFGAAPSVDTKHEIRVNKDGGFDALYIGKIEREGSTYDWMYKGHKNFKDAADQLDGSNDNTLCFTVQEAIEPLYYLVELKDGSNSSHGTTYEYLVPHKEGHHTGDAYDFDNRYEYLLNDSDPLIGTYVAKGFGAATPTLYATAMYLFEQKYEAVSNTVTIDSPAATLRRVKTAPGANPAAGNFGDLPDTGVVQDTAVVEDKTVNESTGMPAYAAVAGATYSKTPEGDMVTGVEDVLADGEGAEAVYYNLQGVRVDNPASAGVYIRVQGKNVSKVVVK